MTSILKVAAVQTLHVFVEMAHGRPTIQHLLKFQNCWSNSSEIKITISLTSWIISIDNV